MNLVPAKLGADKKKLSILGGLAVVLVVVFFTNRNSSPSYTPPATPAATTTAAAPVVIPRGQTVPRRGSRNGNQQLEDFRPTLKLKEGTDVSKIDPTLKLDLLTKVRNVPMEGGARSLFAFGVPPPPPPPKVNPIQPGTMTANNSGPAAAPRPVAPAPPPGPPPPPPIPLKFYGYANAAVKGEPRRAFFLEGDDIYVAGENDVIKNRYKIIKIGVNSAVVEDTTNKSQQTLKLVEELAG